MVGVHRDPGGVRAALVERLNHRDQHRPEPGFERAVPQEKADYTAHVPPTSSVSCAVAIIGCPVMERPSILRLP